MGSSLIRSLIVQLNAISCVHFGPDSCLMAHLNAISIEFCALQWKQIVKCKSFLYFGDLSYLQHQSIPPLFGAFKEQQFLECTSLLSALQSWFLPMSSVCCDSPSLPFCQSARALWRFLNPPNNNRPLKKPLGFCANQVAQPKTFSYLSLGWELAK